VPPIGGGGDAPNLGFRIDMGHRSVISRNAPGGWGGWLGGVRWCGGAGGWWSRSGGTVEARGEPLKEGKAEADGPVRGGKRVKEEVAAA
jgi:hypothetical protein